MKLKVKNVVDLLDAGSEHIFLPLFFLVHNKLIYKIYFLCFCSHTESQLALLAHCQLADNWRRRPVLLAAVLGAHASRPEAQVVVVFFDGGQVGRDFQLVGGPQAAQRPRRQLPDQMLFVRHFLLAVVVRQDFHHGRVRVEEGAVRDL